MITEDFANFEISKLLKQKGFDIICDYAYNNKGGYFEVDRSNFDEVYCFRPSLALAMKWLREVHSIFICILFLEDNGKYGFTIENTISRKFIITSKNDEYPTYEQTCEAAIKYCLENLI